MREFAKGAAQSDDITAMVLRFGIMTALGRRGTARRLASGSSSRSWSGTASTTCCSRASIQTYLFRQALHQAGRGPWVDLDQRRSTSPSVDAAWLVDALGRALLLARRAW